jgi:hypothetical protein
MRAKYVGEPMPADAGPDERYKDLVRLIEIEGARRKALADASATGENAAQKEG